MAVWHRKTLEKQLIYIVNEKMYDEIIKYERIPLFVYFVFLEELCIIFCRVYSAKLSKRNGRFLHVRIIFQNTIGRFWQANTAD